MDNVSAIIVGVAILAALGIDAYAFDWGNSLFLISKFVDLIDSLAIWR